MFVVEQLQVFVIAKVCHNLQNTKQFSWIDAD